MNCKRIIRGCASPRIGTLADMIAPTKLTRAALLIIRAPSSPFPPSVLSLVCSIKLNLHVNLFSSQPDVSAALPERAAIFNSVFNILFPSIRANNRPSLSEERDKGRGRERERERERFLAEMCAPNFLRHS